MCIRTRLLGGAALAALAATPSVARAMSCADILAMLDDGYSAGVVAGTLRDAGESVGTSTVSCLVEKDAPSEVIEEARRLAGVGGTPTGAPSSGEQDDGWLQEVEDTEAPAPRAPTPEPEVPAPAPPPPEPPPSIGEIGWFAAIGASGDGSPYTDGWRFRAAGQIPLSDRLGVEGRLSYQPDRGLAGISDLTATLVGIAHEGSGSVDFQQPVDVETLRVSALLDIGPGRPTGGVTTVPRLRVGLGLATVSAYYAAYDDGSSDGPPVALAAVGNVVRIPATLEVAQEIWTGGMLGARIVLGADATMQEKPQYSPDTPVTERQLATRLHLGLDLLASPGGR